MNTALMSTILFFAAALLINPTVFASKVPDQTLAATAELRALHEKVMRAHRDSNIDLLMEDEAESYVVGSRGEVSRPTLQQRRDRLGAYLKATRFSEYTDLTEPVVTVAADASAGWVVVQVAAKGRQQTKDGKEVPVEFVSAWVELYEKRQGKWQRVGNVSNFKP